jgi:CysZ protein
VRTILWKSIGRALVPIAVLAVVLQRLLSGFAKSGEVWLEA